MGSRVRRRLSQGERLAYALRKLLRTRRQHHRPTYPTLDPPQPVGPTVRVLCECGKRIAVGTGVALQRLAPRDARRFGWHCGKCGRTWDVEPMAAYHAWQAALTGDRTVRLPLPSTGG